MNSGDQGLWTVNVTNNNPTTAATGVVVSFTIDNGSFDLAASQNLNPGFTCSRPNATHLNCNIGTLAGGGNATVKAVVDTTGVAAPTTINASVSAAGTNGSSGSDTSSLIVDPVNQNESTGYVPPGETIQVGPGPNNLSTARPVNGVLLIPEQSGSGSGFAASSARRPRRNAGPGATVTVSLDDPSTQPTACGGQICLGQILNITNPDDSCGTPPCDPFPGYTDPRHPVLVTIDWFGGVFPRNSTIYKVKNGIGTPIPRCRHFHGMLTNTPCVKKHTVRRGGNIRDVVALLFGDPGIPRR